jgi:hypothetical protein
MSLNGRDSQSIVFAFTVNLFDNHKGVMEAGHRLRAWPFDGHHAALRFREIYRHLRDKIIQSLRCHYKLFIGKKGRAKIKLRTLSGKHHRG